MVLIRVVACTVFVVVVTTESATGGLKTLFASAERVCGAGALLQPALGERFHVESEGHTSTTCGRAEFFRSNISFDVGTGCGGIAREFTVAVVHATTGDVIEIRRFDTWGTRNTGEAMSAMAGFLNGLPDGVLVMIAVADEAGLNQFPPNRCVHLTGAWVENGLQALEALSPPDSYRGQRGGRIEPRAPLLGPADRLGTLEPCSVPLPRVWAHRFLRRKAVLRDIEQDAAGTQHDQQ